jgi:hypothetical protein
MPITPADSDIKNHRVTFDNEISNFFGDHSSSLLVEDTRSNNPDDANKELDELLLLNNNNLILEELTRQPIPQLFYYYMGYLLELLELNNRTYVEF